MRAGKLREIVVFEQSTEADVGYGQKKKTTWSTLASRRAEVRTASASEVRSQGQVTDHTVYTVTVRPQGLSLTTANRLTWRGRTLNIVGFLDAPPRMDELTILAVEEKRPAP